MTTKHTDDGSTTDEGPTTDEPTRGIELTPEHPPERLASLAALAEAEGFDVAFASSHYFNRDPFVTLAGMAKVTENIRLGPGVVNPFDSHPVSLAARTATIDEVSDGRAVFGIGAGDRSALSNLGIEHERPLRRVLESFTLARDLWAGETVSHEGTFVAKDASLNLEPGEIPVYVGAQGPHMLRMSAKYADGVLINASHPRDLEWAAGQLERGLADRPGEGSEARSVRESQSDSRYPSEVQSTSEDASERSSGGHGDPRDGEFEALAFASVSVAGDEDEAREAARPPVAFITAGAAPPVLERHGIDPERATAVSEALERGDLGEAFEAVTPGMIDAFCIAGTTEIIAERFEAALEHVDGIVVGSPLGPDLEDAIGRASEALERATAGKRERER